MPAGGADVRWLRDVAPASWIGPRLHPFGTDAGSVVPEGFEAYGRLLHPVVVDGSERRRWRDVAEANGRIAHPEMQFHLIARPRGQKPPADDRGTGPAWGSLPVDERRVLAELLHDETGTPDRCWFCVWEGFGGLDHQGVPERVALPHRDYLLYAGPLELVVADLNPPSDQSPNLWWPDDRAWVVASEIDLAWTYVGGSERLIERLVGDDRLEVVRARLDHKIGYDTDLLNAALDGR